MQLRLKELVLPPADSKEILTFSAIVVRMFGQDRPFQLQYRDDESGQWIGVPIVNQADVVVTE